MPESIQHKLSRVRPPRVHITYDVEIGNAIVMKELPFVMGVLADLSGQSEKELPKLVDRKFVFIDRDNFNKVMESYAPRVSVRVKNTISGKKDDFTNVSLNFSHIDDFEPLKIIHAVPTLKGLFETRTQLNDLLAALEGNDELEEMLTQLLTSAELRKSIKAEAKKLATKK